MPRDETDETTTEEELSPRARRPRRYPLEESEPPEDADLGDRGRPRPGRGPMEGEEPEPPVIPGSLSRTLGQVALALLALAVLYTAWQHTRRDNSDESDEGRRTEAEEENRVPEAEPEVTTTTADPGAPRDPRCPPEDGPSQPVRSFTGPPPMCIDPSRTYVATLETTRGDIEITLNTAEAPNTVNNFVFLARWRFYEGSGFYQVMPGLSIDTGDPLGQNGQGDVGYSIGEEPPAEPPFYPIMSVYMIGLNRPNSTQSQFGIVTGDAAESIELRFSRLGRVTDGERVVRAIEATGDQLTGIPTTETVIERVTIDER